MFAYSNNKISDDDELWTYQGFGRPRSNTVPRSETFLGFTLSDDSRRVAYNTLIISSLSLSCLFAIAGVYGALYHSVGEEDPWILASPSIFSSGLVLITYSWGGLLSHGKAYGWAFFQPGRGGRQFVLLQAASWTCVGVSLVIPWLPWISSEISQLHFRPKTTAKHSQILLLVSSASGIISQILTIISLFAYRRPRQWFTWRFIFTERADGKALLYFFMSVQTGLAIYAMIVLFMSERLEDLILGSMATLVFIALIAVSTSLTHGVGGPWLKGDEGFTAFQPGRGGSPFVFLQVIGWASMSLTIVIGISRATCAWVGDHPRPIVNFFAKRIIPQGATSLGLLGLFSQIVLTLSLFIFEESEFERATRFWKTKIQKEKEAWISCNTGLPPEIKKRIMNYL